MVRERLLALCLALAAASGCGSDGKQTTPDGSVCVPTSCAAEGKNCGYMPDGCGGLLQCGTCQTPQVCGGGGFANVCGTGTCLPTTCAAQAKDCGDISDGCADVLDCGTCEAPQTCGGGGVPNVCGGSAPTDGGVPVDGSTSLCGTECMSQPGAVCCMECGCQGEILCYPECGDYTWDCEMGCCYDYENYVCK